MPFQMQKTRLNLDTRHRIGNHLIDVAAEVGVDVVALHVVVVVLSGRVLNGKRAPTQVKKTACGRPKSRANGGITARFDKTANWLKRKQHTSKSSYLARNK